MGSIVKSAAIHKVSIVPRATTKVQFQDSYVLAMCRSLGLNKIGGQSVARAITMMGTLAGT